MKVETKKFARFVGRDCIVYKEEYIFSATEARFKHGLVDETAEYTMQYAHYTDKDDLQKALSFMPDYECWDSDRCVLIKEIR